MLDEKGIEMRALDQCCNERETTDSENKANLGLIHLKRDALGVANSSCSTHTHSVYG